MSRLSRSLNARNDSLASLLKNAADVSKILGKRSDKLNTLLLNGNDLLGVLNDRRLAISNLLANTSVVAQQLTGLVKDNEAKLAPTLQRLNSVLAMLENQRDNLSKALPGLAKFELTQGETVSTAASTTTPSCPMSSRPAAAAVLRLRIRLPPRYQRRPAAGQCRPAGRASVPVQRHSAAQ